MNVLRKSFKSWPWELGFEIERNTQASQRSRWKEFSLRKKFGVSLGKETGVYLHLVVAISLRNTRRLHCHPRLLAKSVRRWGNWICWITYVSQLEGRSSLFRGQLQDDYCMERWKGESLFFVPRRIVELLNILFSYLNCFVHVFDGKCEKPFTTLTACQLNAKFLWARCWCLTELKIAWRLWLRKNVFRNRMNRMRLLRSSSRADLC